jgi:hypothetical protein
VFAAGRCGWVVLKPLVSPPLPLMFLLLRPRVSLLAPVAGGKRKDARSGLVPPSRVGTLTLPKRKLPFRTFHALSAALLGVFRPYIWTLGA